MDPKRKRLYVILIVGCILTAQQVIPLYEGLVPFAKPFHENDHEFIDSSWNKNGILTVDHISQPTLSVYKAPKDKRKGTAVIICPGGGYRILAAGHEGSDVAKAKRGSDPTRRRRNTVAAIAATSDRDAGSGSTLRWTASPER